MLQKESLQFLADLKENNYRDWFLANKKRYEAYKQDYHQLVGALLDALKPLDESLEPLEIKNCTFRINRDIRFSKDKSPYKDHMGMWFSGGTKGVNRPGYYVHISQDGCFVAGGFYQPEAEDLRRIRKEIEFFHEDLEAILDAPDFKKVYGGLDVNENNSLRTAPKGFDKEHPAIGLLKLKSFTASAPFKLDEVLKKDFVSKTTAKLILLKPLNEFISRGLTQND